MSRDDAAPEAIDALVVGAGFAGLYALHLLRSRGLSVRTIEAADDVGGTWYWNRYPGARCDVPSHYYSYSWDEDLQQEWRWSEKYSTQPEILSYLRHVADRYDLRRDITFGTRVELAAYDEESATWLVRLSDGGTIRCRYLVSAVGNLSAANVPAIHGLADFSGRTFHTGHWPHEEVSFARRRVGVIGTGSSGTQVIPAIATQAAQTTVFQRTPNYSIPAWNEPISDEQDRAVKQRYRELREIARHTSNGTVRNFNPELAVEQSAHALEAEYERRWAEGGGQFMNAYADLLTDPTANDTAAAYVRRKIREIVQDPEVARRLTPNPSVTPIGAKRISVDTGYYATYNRENVELVDVRATPITRITPSGIDTAAAHYDIDDLVLATGFDAMTGSILAMDIRGRDGRSLREAWAEGPRTYLGVQSAGFPNFFIITGPGSPSVLSNMVVSIEQHVEWIADLIRYAMSRSADFIEPIDETQTAWMNHVREVADATLLPRANSWYLGANIPGKPQVFMPYIGVGRFRRICDEEAAAQYPGFAFSRTGLHVEDNHTSRAGGVLHAGERRLHVPEADPV